MQICDDKEYKNTEALVDSRTSAIKSVEFTNKSFSESFSRFIGKNQLVCESDIAVTISSFRNKEECFYVAILKHNIMLWNAVR